MSLKEKARKYFTAVNHYDAAAVEEWVDENYIQHNPFVPTGRAAFVALLPKLKQHGSRIHNVRMLEDGHHVIMHHRWENAAPFGHDRTAAFHIIRFDSRGLIAEHWNVMTPDLDAGGSLTDGTTRIEDFSKTQENKSRIAEQLETLIASPQIDRSPWPASFREDSPTYSRLHKIFGEGNFTLSISEGLHRGTLSAIYDLFRSENGKTVEHWRVAQAIPTQNLANTNTMFGF